MIMPIKYTDEMVADALAMRARGEKQSVIYATFGPGIESAIRRVRARGTGKPEMGHLERAAYLLQKVIDSGALAVEQHEALEADVAAFLAPPVVNTRQR